MSCPTNGEQPRTWGRAPTSQGFPGLSHTCTLVSECICTGTKVQSPPLTLYVSAHFQLILSTSQSFWESAPPPHPPRFCPPGRRYDVIHSGGGGRCGRSQGQVHGSCREPSRVAAAPPLEACGEGQATVPGAPDHHGSAPTAKASSSPRRSEGNDTAQPPKKKVCASSWVAALRPAPGATPRHSHRHNQHLAHLHSFPRNTQ